jgi:S-adenosylmethionine decarboxylase
MLSGPVLGVHWIADVAGCAPTTLEAGALRRVLVELPDRLELTRIGEPQLFHHHEDETAPDTIAGIVLIAESHVSVHCFPAERAVHIDVFSCKALDLEIARRYVTEFFEPTDIVERVLERGTLVGREAAPRARVRRGR